MAVRTEPTKFDLRREATRAELIRLALERFPIKGYALTSIEDIVRDSGLSRGAYYFHFESKGDLFLSCLEELEPRRGDIAEIARDPRITSLDEALVEVYQRFRAVDGKLEWPLLQTEFWQISHNEPELAERFRGLYRRWIEKLTELLEGLRDRGFITVEGPLEPFTEVIFAMGQGMDIHRLMYGADDSRYFDVVLRALRS